MARLGVIDLGSNSVRLVVYETKREDAAKPFRTLVDEKKMAGLAAYVTDGALSSAGIARAVTVLGDLLKLADNLNCARVDIFATAVLRNCANSEAATAAIETAINHRVRVLSAREEAHLGFVGASIGTPLAAGTLIDVGGGSTELTALASDGDHAGISIPFGCVLAYANYVRCIIPTPAECRTIADAFRKELQALPNLEGYRSERLYGIGGSVRALAKMVAAVWGDDTRPKSISRKELETFLILLNPFAPHITEEIWEAQNFGGMLNQQSWPEYDEAKCVDATVEIAVQISGKIKARINVPTDATKEQLLAAAKENGVIASILEGKTIVKEIVVPGKLVNIVAK